MIIPIFSNWMDVFQTFCWNHSSKVILYGPIIRWLSGLTGELGVPYTVNRQYTGGQQGAAPLNIQAHRATMRSCPVESVFAKKTAGGLLFMHQSGKPGQVLTGAASLRTTDVYGVAGLRSDVANLNWDEGSTPVARRCFDTNS